MQDSESDDRRGKDGMTVDELFIIIIISSSSGSRHLPLDMMQKNWIGPASRLVGIAPWRRKKKEGKRNQNKPESTK